MSRQHPLRSDAQTSAEPLELAVGQDLALAEAHELVEGGAVALGSSRGVGRSDRLLGPPPALTTRDAHEHRIGASGERGISHHLTEQDHWGTDRALWQV